MQAIHIEGRRWFQRTYGNTYHSVRVTVNGKSHVIPMQYGYGEQYLQTAAAYLKSIGAMDCDYQGTAHLREVIGATWSVADVARKRDLH